MKRLRHQVTNTSLACTVAMAGATLGFTAAAPKQAAAQTPSCERDQCNWGNALCVTSPSDTNCDMTGPNSCTTSWCSS